MDLAFWEPSFATLLVVVLGAYLVWRYFFRVSGRPGSPAWSRFREFRLGRFVDRENRRTVREFRRGR